MDKNSKLNWLAALGMTAVLSVSTLSLVGCGGSSSNSSNSGSSVATSGSSADEEEEATTDTSEDSSEDSSTTSDSSSSTSSDVTFDDVEAAMTSAYMGTNEDTGEGYYLAFNDDGSLAMVAVLNTNSGADNATSASWVGKATVNGNNVTVTDIANGGMIGFDVTNNDDGTITLDLGDEYGKATVAQVDVSEVVNAFKTIDKYTTAVQ